LVAVLQRGGGAPLEGAHILLDGFDAGVTGKDGTVRVFAKRKPARVDCTYKDWSVVGKIDLAPAWTRGNKSSIRIEMKPPQRKR
jgi:hypothetical protein